MSCCVDASPRRVHPQFKDSTNETTQLYVEGVLNLGAGKRFSTIDASPPTITRLHSCDSEAELVRSLRLYMVSKSSRRFEDP